MAELDLILVSPEPLLCAEFREQFKDLPRVEVVDGYFERLPEFDCLVSPANSFGLMDGGMDAAITRFFGDGLQQRVQQRILAEYLGEQPSARRSSSRPAIPSIRTWHTRQPCGSRCRSRAPITRIWPCGRCCWQSTGTTREPTADPRHRLFRPGHGRGPHAVSGSRAADGAGVPQLSLAASADHGPVRPRAAAASRARWRSGRGAAEVDVGLVAEEESRRALLTNVKCRRQDEAQFGARSLAAAFARRSGPAPWQRD